MNSSIFDSIGTRQVGSPQQAAGPALADHNLEWLPDNKRSRTRLSFSGSGNEFFKIWIVNLLLTVVTLGIYGPWAKVRRLKYFYNHTEAAGDALDFHGSPRKMLRGSAFVGVFLLAYAVASNFSLVAGVIAVLAFVGLWPILWWSGLKFHLANTSWRGMRFAFVGSKRDAWITLGIPMAIYLIPLAIGSGLAIDAGEQTKGGKIPPMLELAGAISAAALLAAAISLPWLLFRIKRYQHGSYRLGQLRTELRTTTAKAYAPFLALLGLMLIVGILFALLLGLVGFTLGLPGLLIAGSLGYVFLVITPMAYLAAKLQNLWWSRTGNRFLRFRSDLSASGYMMLSFKNLLFTIFTLGLYRPYAQVAAWRMRVEAVSIESRVSFESLAGQVQQSFNDAAGEMAGDLAGPDLGW